MSLVEKRMDAAHTLVVPYDATPQMVQQAYERRLEQRFKLQNTDRESYFRGNELLYDARVRMETPENEQWRAQLRLMATGRVDKLVDSLMVMLSLVRRKSKSVFTQVLVDELMVDVPRMHRKYKIMRGIAAYEIGALGAMVTHDLALGPQAYPVAKTVLLGTMLISVGAVVLLHKSLQRDLIIMSARSTLLSYDKMFRHEK